MSQICCINIYVFKFIGFKAPLLQPLKLFFHNRFTNSPYSRVNKKTEEQIICCEQCSCYYIICRSLGFFFFLWELYSFAHLNFFYTTVNVTLSLSLSIILIRYWALVSFFRHSIAALWGTDWISVDSASFACWIERWESSLIIWQKLWRDELGCFIGPLIVMSHSEHMYNQVIINDQAWLMWQPGNTDADSDMFQEQGFVKARVALVHPEWWLVLPIKDTGIH